MWHWRSDKSGIPVHLKAYSLFHWRPDLYKGHSFPVRVDVHLSDWPQPPLRQDEDNSVRLDRMQNDEQKLD